MLNVLTPIGKIWQEHTGNWSQCERCEIGKIAFRKVFARGTLPCDILFIGEAPGDTENIVSHPFVGKAGRTFSALLTAVSGKYFASLPPEIRISKCFEFGEHSFTWAVTNVVLCRPADSAESKFREPTVDEKNNCRPRLHQFIRDIAKPRGVVFLGKHAAGDALAGFNLKTTKTVHPSFINRCGGPESEHGKHIFLSAVDQIAKFVGEVLK